MKTPEVSLLEDEPMWPETLCQGCLFLQTRNDASPFTNKITINIAKLEPIRKASRAIFQHRLAELHDFLKLRPDL